MRAHCSGVTVYPYRRTSASHGSRVAVPWVYAKEYAHQQDGSRTRRHLCLTRNPLTVSLSFDTSRHRSRHPEPSIPPLSEYAFKFRVSQQTRTEEAKGWNGKRSAVVRHSC